MGGLDFHNYECDDDDNDDDDDDLPVSHMGFGNIVMLLLSSDWDRMCCSM